LRAPNLNTHMGPTTIESRQTLAAVLTQRIRGGATPHADTGRRRTVGWCSVRGRQYGRVVIGDDLRTVEFGASTADYEDGVWWVEFAGLQDPELVPHALLTAFGFMEQPRKGPTESQFCDPSLPGRREGGGPWTRYP
jgi:hypothetical protein